MKYLEKFLPKAAKPYAAEIAGGGLGYGAWRLMFGRIYRRGQEHRSTAFGTVVGAAAADASVTREMLPNAIGVAAAYLSMRTRLGRRVGAMVHKMTYKVSYNASDFIVPLASYAVGKAIAKKVGG